MSGIVLRVGEFTLTANGRDDEPRIEALELGRLLGYADPKLVRRLISRQKKHLGDFSVTVTENPNGTGRPLLQQHLTESQALFIAAKSETVVGAAVLTKLIAVYVAAKKQLASETSAAPTYIHAELVNGPRIRDDRAMDKHVRDLCRLAAQNSGRSNQSIQGDIRKSNKVLSIYDLSWLFYDMVTARLNGIIAGFVKLAPVQQRLRLVDMRAEKRQPLVAPKSTTTRLGA